MNLENLTISELESYYNLCNKELELKARECGMNHSIDNLLVNEGYRSCYEIMKKLRNEVNKRLLDIKNK